MRERDTSEVRIPRPRTAPESAADWRRRAARWRLPMPQLSTDDRAALGMWGAAHLALLVLAWAAAWTYRTTPDHAPLTGVFEHWDAIWLRNIAQHGYFSGQSKANSVAFFPGFPIALAAVHLVLRNWVLSELVLSATASAFAFVSLARLAGDRRAILYLLAAPTAIFLLVGYSEGLFLALAIPAWDAAARGRWWRAAAFAGVAGLVRPDALFLVGALAVMALTQAKGARITATLKVSCALAGPAVYEAYLWASTGHWNAWMIAQKAGWGIRAVTPLQAVRTTWTYAFGHFLTAGVSYEFQLELVAMGVILLATLLFLGARRWPEATYCALAAIALGLQFRYQTVPRTLLLLFPIWIGLAHLSARWPWVRYVYLGVSAPIAVVMGLMFLAYQWTG